MNKKEQEMLDNLIMKFIEKLKETGDVYGVIEEAQEWLNDLNEKNKYKSYRVDCSLKNFNYRQHRQEIANAECYKLIKSNDELLTQWERRFLQKYEMFGDELEFYRYDFKNAYLEIYGAYVKTVFFSQENVCILSSQYNRSLYIHINNLKEWLDKLINLIESSKKEEE